MFRFSLPRGLVVAAVLFAGLPATSRAAVIGNLPPPVANAGAAACPTAPTSLQYYVTNFGGLAGCSIGIATFFDFNVGTFTGTSATAADIMITPTFGLGVGGPTLVFSADPAFFHVADGTTSTFNFGYDVDPPIDILGFGLDDAPFSGGAAVAESACIANAANTNYCSSISTLGISTGDPSDSDTSFATHFLRTSTTVTLTGPATIDSFSESFRVAAVPEPGLLALGAIGGLALLGTSRARRRAKPAR